jgi:outer membrane protein TolC
VGVFVKWDLFDGGASFSKAREADARRVQAEAAQMVGNENSVVDLETWKRRYDYGFQLYRTALEDIRKSQESVRMAREGSRQGVRTVSEQLDAQLDLFRARANEVNAQLMAAQALLQLELATGQPLEAVRFQATGQSLGQETVNN